MRATVVLISVLCSACSVPLPPSGLEPPSARLMVPPAGVDDVKPGDDLAANYIKLKRQYLTETRRLRSLQGYVKKLSRPS